MRTQTLPVLLSFVLGISFSLVGTEAYAAKKRKQIPPPEPVPAPLTESGTIIASGADPCCDHKCCRRHDRKCRHECAVVPSAPCIEYKGCPPPCGVTKVVAVTHPKTCYTIEVAVQVPGYGCERVDRDRDGDVELDYGKYEVSIKWKDGGRRLVVDYDD